MEQIKILIDKGLAGLRTIFSLDTLAHSGYENTTRPVFVLNTYREIASDPSLGLEIITDDDDQTLHCIRDGWGSEITFRCSFEALDLIKSRIYSEEVCEVEMPEDDKNSEAFLRAQEQQAISLWERIGAVIFAHADVIS